MPSDESNLTPISKSVTLGLGTNTELSAFTNSLGVKEITTTNSDSGIVIMKFRAAPIVLNGYFVDFNSCTVSTWEKTPVPPDTLQLFPLHSNLLLKAII